MKKSVKIAIAFIAVIVIIAGVLLAAYLVRVSKYKQKAKEINIHEVSMSEIADGKYIGECNLDLVYVKVEVTIKDHSIEKIVLLEHKNGKGQPAERIVNDIVEQQKINVDSVTGATNSSVAIKAAVIDSLT